MSKAAVIKLVAGILVGGGIGALMGYWGQCTSGTCPLTANPYRGAIYGAVLGLLFSFSFKPASEAPDSETNDTEGAEGKGSALLEISSEEAFKARVLESDELVLADFSSSSCPACRKLAPVVEKLARDYKGNVVVCKVDIDKAPSLAKQYGIQGVPAVLFFRKGIELERIGGFHTEEDYIKILNHYIENNER